MAKEELLKAEFNGPLEIGEIKIDASVLDDKQHTRVLSYRSVSRALDLPEKWSTTNDGATRLPHFLTRKPVKTLIKADLSVPLSKPIEYKPLHGGRSAFGVPAKFLPSICDVWLKARDAGLLKSQKDRDVATKADLLMRAFAHVGIIALVDEATGYQEVREKEELQKILKKYISEELLPWTLRFPHEFYKEMFRLKGWQYNATSRRKKPMQAGQLTRNLIYDKLPEGVIEELSRKNPRKTKGGNRKYHHHRFLTEDVGNPHLSKQIAVVTALMRVSPNWRKFSSIFEKAFNPQQQMDYGEEKDE